ncbi:unnamed protein product [Brugia timori]|uniref:Uncharacterized protein n=1 Tax=Brugia timori TaxID=42155 RepID=A0A0R3QQF3_9BILA|nr:unnamed protein product [Brugia timori]
MHALNSIDFFLLLTKKTELTLPVSSAFSFHFLR